MIDQDDDEDDDGDGVRDGDGDGDDDIVAYAAGATGGLNIKTDFENRFGLDQMQASKQFVERTKPCGLFLSS